MAKPQNKIIENKTTPGVIILGGHVQGLNILRIFGNSGIQGVVIDNTPINLAKHSKFCKKFYHIPDDKLLDSLLSLKGQDLYNNWVIFPTNDLHVGIIEVAQQELPTWTLQSDKPLNVTQTVYGLKSGVKYHLLFESKVIREKVADAKGSLSFSVNLTNRDKKQVTVIEVSQDNIKD